jgi:hypothetical protein
VKLVIATLLLAATAAHADDRCAKGIELAKQPSELARAALYLDSCSDDDGIRVRNDVEHKLEATQLSHITITSLPDGVAGETDAMPGETFTTPATIWAKAGTYKITVGGQTVEKTLEPHSRTTVIINVPPPPKPSKNGVVSFEEEPEQHQGAPPAVKHGTMMPKRYLKPGAPAGEPLDDPFALRGPDANLAWRLGVRLTGGVEDSGNAHASLGVAAVADRPLDGPFMLTTRLDYNHRQLDAIAANVGLGYLAVQRPSYVLTVSAEARAEIRLQSTLDMMPVDRVGVGAAGGMAIALLDVPLVFGVRGELSASELLPGSRPRALLVEVGYDWR